MISEQIKKIAFWLNCARVYSLPVTVMSWLVIFVWGWENDGNIYYGLLALVGIASAHLATNLLDDYLDYKILIKNKEYMDAAQTSKCAFLRDGSTTPEAWMRAIIFFCTIAAIVGVILTLFVGWPVILLSLMGAVIVLAYQKFSLTGLGEVAVFIAFGPLIFEGVYYVMTGHFSVEVLILAVAVAMVDEGLIYTHMLLDYDADKVSHKKTLSQRIGSYKKALWLLYGFYFVAYLAATAFTIMTGNEFVLLTFLTIPIALKLCVDMQTQGTKEEFYPRFARARDIITYFALLLAVALCL